MKKTILILALSFAVLNLFSQSVNDYFITTWKTDNTGTSGPTSVNVPVSGIYEAIWEDLNGNTVTPTVSGTTYTFTVAGTYKLKLVPGSFKFAFGTVAGDNPKLLTVEQWGTNQWPKIMDAAFYNCVNMDVKAVDPLVFPTPATGVASFFYGCTNLIGNPSFNTWDVSRVINFFSMFRSCSKFNQPIDNWSMGNAQDLRFMFTRATSFNQPLNNWNTSNVINTSTMFLGATNFNQPLYNWDMSKNADMSRMFEEASAFNQNISVWTTNNVASMSTMFISANKFNQNLGAWDLTKVTNMTNMLSNTAMDCFNYDATLIGWANNPNTPNRTLAFGATGRVYSSPGAVAARNALVAKGWTISGDTYNASCNPSGITTTVSGAISMDDVHIAPNNSLIIYKNSTLTINPGKQLNNEGTVVNTGTIKLLSDETNGTATIVGNVSGNAEVQQYLPSQRNWYMSSPVTKAARPGAEYSFVESYNETNSSWVETTGNLEVGRGYVIYPDADVPKTITFAGELNNGSKSINLTRTSKPSEVGFNLVGNLYPSYLNANDLLHNNAASVLPTIWYRTNNGTTWSFPTFNAESGLGVPTDDLGKVPPMQGFWVRAKSNNVSLNFADALRLSNSGATIPFKAPKAVLSKVLRLQVNTGTVTDEALLYFNSNASDSYDNYDSPKMQNNGTTVPNIYTKVGAEKLIINGMNEIPYDTQIPLYVEGNAGNYEITVSEFKNFMNTDKVLLIDNKSNSQIELNNTNYPFAISDGEDTSKRFFILFPKSGTPTDINTKELNLFSVSVIGSQLIVSINENELNGEIKVYNSIGQQIISQKIIETNDYINFKFNPGVYIVKINNQTTKVLVK